MLQHKQREKGRRPLTASVRLGHRGAPVFPISRCDQPGQGVFVRRYGRAPSSTSTTSTTSTTKSGGLSHSHPLSAFSNLGNVGGRGGCTASRTIGAETWRWGLRRLGAGHPSETESTGEKVPFMIGLLRSLDWSSQSVQGRAVWKMVDCKMVAINLILQ